MRRKREKEERGIDEEGKREKKEKNPRRAFVSVCRILDFTVILSISCTMYKVTTSFEVNVPSMMNVVFSKS